MVHIDINCDTGEGIGNDEDLMPFITSANIACGYHAGNGSTMRETVLMAKDYGVLIGAHPSFDDPENFGRTEMTCSPEEVYDLVVHQIRILEQIAVECNAYLHHVKPHGALYNMAARDQQLARAVAVGVKDSGAGLVLYGLSGSYLVSEGKALGLRTASEVFADRTYRDDGSLTPRNEPGALIEDPAKAVEQVLQMVSEGTVTSRTGKKVPIVAETVCIHGDGKSAVAIAKAIQKLTFHR